jgi:peptidoglycan glycosyltransferase
MNPRIRWVGVVLLLCFVLLFVQLNNIQVRQAKALSQNPLAGGGQTSAKAFDLSRGAILSADKKILAYTAKVGGLQTRIYPPATAVDFGQITGSVDYVDRAIEYGIEEEYNQFLAQHQSSVNSLKSLVTQHQETDNVFLTIPSNLQADAANLLASRPAGAQIVALDPRTGAILAMDGTPNYDPNTLAGHDRAAVEKAFSALALQNPEPFLSLASATTHAPGSTFKVIDTAGIFDHMPSLASKVWQSHSWISLPGTTQTFQNFNGEPCGGDLATILATSCDTAYAYVGMALGATNVVNEAQAFGWCQGAAGVCKGGGSRPPLDLPHVDVAGATIAPLSVLAPAPAFLAYSSIGQYNDRASALSMALVASGIADYGRIMAPHLMSQIIDSAGNVVRTYSPHMWKQATSAATAIRVRQLMLGVTDSSAGGTAAGVFTNLQANGIGVAAKTGTAEVVKGVCATNDWMIAMAPAGPGQTPTAVVAAEIPTPSSSIGCNEATGAAVAGPVVDQMLTDVLQAVK